MKNAIIFILFSMSCQPSTHKTVTDSEPISIDIQGHRGCRGLMPENTIPAFLKALELGVTTLEMDLAISKDKKVVVSHEPFFNHEMSTGPKGEEISEENEKSHNLYELDYDQIKNYDVGSKPHPRFPGQKKMIVAKPLLSEVVKEAKEYAFMHNTPEPFYNIEIKRNPKYDNTYHPDAEEFAALVLQEIENSGIQDKVIVQSFDLESLRVVRKMNKSIPLALLIENRKSAADNIKELGFKPEIYSTYFLLLNAAENSYLKSEGIKNIPWTVNEEKDIAQILDWELDGIISDYPDRVNKVIAERK